MRVEQRKEANLPSYSSYSTKERAERYRSLRFAAWTALHPATGLSI